MFKFFEKWKVEVLGAVVVNYLVCVILGFILASQQEIAFSISSPWLPAAIVLGSTFIGVFLLISIVTQKIGVAVGALSMKLSFVLPVLLAFFFYEEEINTTKVLGVVLAIVAVVIITLNRTSAQGKQIAGWLLIYPLIIWLGSGLADALVQNIERRFFPQGGQTIFVTCIFACAATLGMLALLFRNLKRDKKKALGKRELIGGLVLGIPNYGSIYFFMETLNYFKNPEREWLGDAGIFSINNLGVVLFSSLVAIILFRERINSRIGLGLVLAVGAIVLFWLA